MGQNTWESGQRARQQQSERKDPYVAWTGLCSSRRHQPRPPNNSEHEKATTTDKKNRGAQKTWGGKYGNRKGGTAASVSTHAYSGWTGLSCRRQPLPPRQTRKNDHKRKMRKSGDTRHSENRKGKGYRRTRTEGYANPRISLSRAKIRNRPVS